jgi:hypothetical protein
MRALWAFCAALLVIIICAANIEPAYSAFASFRINGAGISVTIPVNTVVPAISGLSPPQVGNALTSSTGTFTQCSACTYAYQWKSAGTNVGTNVNSYSPVSGDIGHTVTVTVTATNTAGSTPATSTATSAVIAATGSVAFTALHTYFMSPTGSGTTCS